jgi:hypothetical protein
LRVHFTCWKDCDIVDYIKWHRVNFEKPDEPSVSTDDPKRRESAEEETRRDLQKPIQQ